ncbi:MAG: hypothetical protein KF883_08320 [Thermomicrobiales bacterium]|nr:hypothetical protein [Thermomicrobiales bacterium]
MTDVSTGIERSHGHWITPSVSYVEPLRISCELCGRPIARRYWQERIGGEARIFCEESHADLYLTYWLPTWGADRNP